MHPACPRPLPRSALRPQPHKAPTNISVCGRQRTISSACADLPPCTEARISFPALYSPPSAGKAEICQPILHFPFGHLADGLAEALVISITLLKTISAARFSRVFISTFLWLLCLQLRPSVTYAVSIHAPVRVRRRAFSAAARSPSFNSRTREGATLRKIAW